MDRRILGFGLLLMACFVALAVQLDHIQGLQAKSLQTQGNNPITQRDVFLYPRGTIVSADGTVLARSDPGTVPGSPYKWKRDYPTGSLFADIVGADSLIYGNFTGVEAKYDSDLLYKVQGVHNIGDLFTTPRGTDTVVLTLDDQLQQDARAALNGRDGAVVVLNPSTGAILAMYSNPTFDPNALASLNLMTERNEWNDVYNKRDAEGWVQGVSFAFRQSLPPGSTFKVVTTATAYDHDAFLVNTTFPVVRCAYPGNSAYQIPGAGTPLCNSNYEQCGGTIAEMLPPSCDTGYAMLGNQLGIFNLNTEAQSFGFGSVPPIDLPEAAKSRFPTPADVQTNPPFVPYSAIGQGDVSATPLQMALVAAAIANNGVIMVPHVMAEVEGPQGTVVTRYTPKRWIQATSAATTQAIIPLMEDVAYQGPPNAGTAYGIFPNSWQVAVKTGTAQTGNTSHSTDDWMIGLAPATRPQVAIAVVVPDQAQSASGASVAGPIVYDMLKAILGQGQ